jgi:hypothetical protein
MMEASKTMKLITVNCFRPNSDKDEEPRVGVTIASTVEEAEKMCRGAYTPDGYSRFQADDVVEGQFPGPAQVLGYTGQRLPWKT